MLLEFLAMMRREPPAQAPLTQADFQGIAAKPRSRRTTLRDRPRVDFRRRHARPAGLASSRALQSKTPLVDRGGGYGLPVPRDE
jgi:hypothetical protein